MRFAIRNALARFAPRAVRFLSTHTGIFRVVGLTGIVLSIVAIAFGNNLEAAALAVIGCEFFISSVLIDQFNTIAARLVGGGGGGLRVHVPVFVPASASASSDDEDEAGDDGDDEAGEDESDDDDDDESGDDDVEAPPAKDKDPDFAVN